MVSWSSRIALYSPEAQGRSERAFATHQGRLPKELALAGITDMEQANRYLRERYIPTHNEEFAPQTIETLRQEERLGKDAVIVYAEKYFAVFDVDEYTDILLHLKPKPHERMCRWIKKFRRDKIRAPMRKEPASLTQLGRIPF